MFGRKVLSVVAALAATSSAFPFSLKTSVVEKLDGPPAGWEKLENALNKDTSTIELRIQLINQDMAKFHDLAMNVSQYP